MFHSPSGIYQDTEKLSSNLGKEIDTQFNLKIAPSVDLNAGFSTFFTSASLLYLEKINHEKSFQCYGWVSLDVHPDFFSIKF
jgi:hypothetical protein